MNPSLAAAPGEKEDDAVSERAAELFARRRGGDWSDADQAELDAWLSESVLHEVAWLRVEAITARADQIAAFRALKLAQAVPAGGDKFRYWRFVVPLLAAASVALAAPFAGRFVASLMQPPDRTDSTDVGGRTLLSFSDHTQIELNTDTAMRFRMTTAERTVWLDKGEAWFHVAHDAAHPFTVIVGRHRITDLGTEFLVRRDAGDVNVTVLNGRAALSAEGVQTATLNPGYEAVATPVSLSVTRKTPQELADELAWRRGLLVFRNARLADAVREFNRYNQTKLVIADPAIANMKFTVEIRNDNLPGFLHVAQSLLNLRADREGNDIRLSRASAKQTKAARGL